MGTALLPSHDDGFDRPDHRPCLGFGLGLRPEHYRTVLDTRPTVDWFEIISENYLVPGGKPLYYLDRIREHYPMVMHGVSLSIGGSDPLDTEYLAALKRLAERVEPAWVSDHLCWTGIDGRNLHDLLPLPYTEEAIVHVAERGGRVQDVPRPADSARERLELRDLRRFVRFRVWSSCPPSPNAPTAMSFSTSTMSM